MTDEQIIKALECCIQPAYMCKECPYFDGAEWLDCATALKTDALALIKRQRVEIAKLEAENAEQDQAIINALHHMPVVREEAIREFAERLDGYLTVNCTIEKNAVKSSIADDDIYFHGGKEIAFADVKQRIISILQELTEEQK